MGYCTRSEYSECSEFVEICDNLWQILENRNPTNFTNNYFC